MATVEARSEPYDKACKYRPTDSYIYRFPAPIASLWSEGLLCPTNQQDIKIIKTRPDMNKITYEEEKAALILGITAVFTVWWMFK